MKRLRTVVLRHETRWGGHYDWLLDPGVPGPAGPGLLWAFRVSMGVVGWGSGRVWLARRIGGHRRKYLTYQGMIGGGRGRVWRVGRGWFVPRVWTASRVVMDLELGRCRGRVCLDLVGGGLWRGYCDTK